MRYVKEMRVRFGHADPAGIVFYPRYFEWFHDAFEDMFEQLFGASYAALLEQRGIGYPAVQAACEWRGPARFGELLRIEVYVSRLTPRSATFEYRVSRAGTLLATASIKIAVMTMDSHTPTSLPEDMRTVLAQHLEPASEVPDSSRLRG